MSTEPNEQKKEASVASPAKQEPPKPLTKQQQKAMERQIEFQKKLELEAGRMHKQLQDRFLDFFMASDNPDGEGVQQKIKQLSSQWKIFCMTKNLRPEIHDAVKKYCDRIVDEFKKGIA